jgi:predicted ATPase
MNIGFGYSYILPIIISGLIANTGEILIVENPEAHLHPRAQSRLARFLSKVANTGVQVFIESHSEHILNAIRVSVKKEEIAAADTKVFYFMDDEIVEPVIDSDGRIEDWRDGFFDEWDINLMELM